PSQSVAGASYQRGLFGCGQPDLLAVTVVQILTTLRGQTRPDRLRSAVMSDQQPYNPLDRVELGKSVERALLAQPLVPLPPTARFGGAGLYAIYYTGSFHAYAPIAPP